MIAKAQILKNSTFRRYFLNSSWMLAEQFLRILSGVFVGIYIARYLGPEEFGVLSYVLAIATFMIAICRLGMDAILVRELVSAPEKRLLLMGTAFWMMVVAALCCCLLVGVVVWSSGEILSVKVYASIIAVSTIFTSFLVVDFYFQSQVKAKYSAICKSLALFLMALVKLCLIFAQADLIWFVVAFMVDYAVLAVILVVAALGNNCSGFFRLFSWYDARQMLRSAWPLVLGAVAIQVYMRIDQLMIRNMLGLHEVGIYSAAVRVYEAWAIVTAIITVSLLPAIVKLKQGDEANYHKRLAQLFGLLIWMSVLAAIAVSLVSENLMVLAFGGAYRAAAPVVDIIMWTAVFAAMGSVSARYFNVEKMERKFALRTALAALVNVGLNFLLIPIYGIEGAAIATLACTFFANYLMDWFDRDLKSLLRIKHRAMFGRSLG
ncbi:flippase [Pseudomonas sp. MBLB4136]|uniref:flippase n=1 Tax=Pseudomonas sp. MBLB4136 TaxID=3451558 RepID=UPI003F75315D